MENYLRFALPVFVLLFIIVTVVRRAYLVQKKILDNPIVLRYDDTLYGFVNRYLKFSIIAFFIYVGFYTFCPELYIEYLAWTHPQDERLAYAGIILAA